MASPSSPGRGPLLPRRAAAAIALLVALAPSLVAVSCGRAPQEQECFSIPSGGCPSDRGGTCADPTCRSLYLCSAGQWQFEKDCPASTGEGGGQSMPDGGPDAREEPDACTPFSFDHDGEAPFCSPDLEEPDCPADVAEGCLETACQTGCDDFFLCSSKGWIDVGYCDDDGGFHDSQK